MNEHQLQRIEKELGERLGGTDIVGTADFATRALALTLSEVRRLRSENAQLSAKKLLVA